MAIPTDFDISTALENFENHSGPYPRSERYTFFDTMLNNVDWENAVILDLGGNRGNLLEDLQQKKIGKEENYYCLDVDHEALNFGQSNYPNANWVSYDAFNPMYNKRGVLSQKFPFEDNMFDVICCYSVYSHTTHENFIHDLQEIERVLKPNGQVAITFVDHESVRFFLDKRKADYPGKFILNQIDINNALQEKRLEYIYFVDNNLLVDEIHNPEGIKHLVTVYHKDWLEKELNSVGLDVTIKQPMQGHIQKTIVFNGKN